MRSVVVDAEEVEPTLPPPRLLRELLGERRPPQLEDVGRIATAEQRVEEPAVVVPVEPARRLDVARIVGERPGRREVEHDSAAAAPRADHIRAGLVCGEQVVDGSEARPPPAPAGRVNADGVAEEAADGWFVHRQPGGDEVGEALEHHVGELGEPHGSLGARPTAARLERVRQRPVVERGQRRDLALEQRFDQALVVVEPTRLDSPDTVGEDAGPRDLEPVGGDAEGGEQLDVLAPAPVAPLIAPGRRTKTSQMDSPLPSASTAPSTW